MQNNQIEITKIIPKNIVPKLQFSKFKIALVNKKAASKVINILRQLQALKAKLSYLKRVRNMSQQINGIQCVQILLCQQSEIELGQKILQRFELELKQDILKIISIQIPINSPINKQQFSQWSQHWPMNFIEPSVSKQTFHWKQQLYFLQKLIQQPAQIVLFADKILFDYKLNQQQGRPQCQTCNYPPNHPIIQIAQLWPQTQQFLSQQKEISKQSYYYFTSLRLIVKDTNLCEMCSMGLVHSRLQRIYFYKCFPSESIQKILFCQKLNHKVEMFELKIVKE